MSTDKQALAEAIKQLDPANDAHWTDDGSPMISEVQRLCNDAEITRANINDAVPGYDRKVASFRGGLKETKSGQGVGGDKQPDAKITVTDPVVAAPEPQAAAAAEDDTLSIERTREILKRRVADADAHLSATKIAAAEAQREVGRAEARLNRAITDLQRKFPPISPEEAIKQHLARQQELARARAEATGYGSDIDRQKALTRKGGYLRGSTVAA